MATSNVVAQKKDKKSDKKDIPLVVNEWTLGKDYSPVEYDLSQDTSLHLFQVYDKIDKSSISNSNLGNMASPYISNIFDDRPINKWNSIIFFNYLNDFWNTPEKTKYYQVNHPYTVLYYATTPKARNCQIVDFTHTQNVNKKLNWAFNINLDGSEGRITNQHTRLTSIAPNISYRGKHFSIHAFYKFNKFQIQENGGIIDTVEITDKRFNTKMSKSDSYWGYRHWGLVSEYSIGTTDFKIINDTTRTEIYTPRLAFNYIFDFEKQFRTYTDNDMDTSIYHNFFKSKKSTYDSIFFRRLTNKVQLKVCEGQLMGYSPGLRGALGVEHEMYYNLTNHIESLNQNTYQNTFFEAGIFKNKSKNLFLNADYKQYLTGYRSGDVEFNANLGYKYFKNNSDTINGYLNATFDFYNTEPTYFEQKYNSNNFKWNNNFSKTQVTRIGAEFGIPRWHLKIGASNYLLNKYIYFNTDVVPEQCSDAITVQTISLQKDFFVWHVRFANRFTWQNSNKNEIFNLPKYALYHSTYFEFYLVKNVLLTQIGGEVRYSGEYNAFGYSPATSVFYPSSRYTVGNYPIINGFFNIKIKGVLMFFKWEHINDEMFQDYYAPTDVYPIPDFHFMFGILWRFNN
ncbi:MAG: putative porin [Bacteroidales bacterium]|nr:putative porin [Bacteroidales bacterium]